MKRVAALFLFLLLSACDDGPSGPVPVRDVEIVLNAAPANEHTLEVGQTVQLGANTLDASGAPLLGRPVTWRSNAPGVASVDTTGLVTARAPGSALIIASAEQVEDTVRVQVVAPPPPPPADIACAEGDPGLNLAVGEVYTTSAARSQVICLNAAGGSEYVYIPFNASTSSALLRAEVAGAGVIPVTGPPLPSVAPSFSMARLQQLSPLRVHPPVDFHGDLRQWERENYQRLRSARRGAGTGPNLSRAAAGRAVPAVGDTLHLNVQSQSGCGDLRRTVGRVEAVTDRAIVVADTANPAGGFTREDYRSFGITFDTLVWKVVTSNFGEPSDIDNNGRVVLLYTRAVNELTEANSEGVVQGFFFGRDLFPATGTDGCAGSNVAEMFYLLVPDTAGLINQNRRTRESVLESTVGVIAHEFQHLINFGHRLRNDADTDEEVWLNEGLSHIAEELIFYHLSGAQPGSNIGIEEFRASTRIWEAFLDFQLSNMGRYITYLEDPADESLLGKEAGGDDDLTTRGATWSFLRYAADRKSPPGVQSQLWRALADSRFSGVANLRAALGVEPIDWMQDWTASVYTDDILPVPARYQQPSWNWRSILGPNGLRSGSTRQPIYPVFPLDVIPLQAGVDNQVDLQLRGGGAAYVRFGIAAGGQAAIRTTSGGVAAPERLRLTIVRTK